MKAGFLQFKPEFGQPAKNSEKVRSLLKDRMFDLIVLPELANSGYLFSDKSELEHCSENPFTGEFTGCLKEICAEKNCHIVSGLCERDGELFYNSSVLVYPDGRIKVYRKIHLFDSEKKWFAPGNMELEVHEISGKDYRNVKTGMMICFDWIFPETARTLALKGAQIICHPSNLVMQYCQRAMFARALENHVFTITSNRTGKESNGGDELIFTGESVILSPKGEYLFKGSAGNEEYAVTDIDPDEALNKFVRPANNLFDDRRSEFYKL